MRKSTALVSVLVLAACGSETTKTAEYEPSPQNPASTITCPDGSVVRAGSGCASPPPPPPPPPAPMRDMAYAEAIAVTGSPVMVYEAPQDRERYAGEEVSNVFRVADIPVSTFSVDVDTGAYANGRRFLQQGALPPSAAVRTEEYLNYFRYDYPVPDDRSRPFSVTTDVAATPWNEDTRLLRIGIRGYDIKRDERPAANLTFLVDVSGSMSSPDKLGLVKTALRGLADELREDDRVSIVVYAGRTAVVLEPTSDKNKVKAALSQLESGGSTAGAAGLALAYEQARSAYIEGGINRVLLATDGDFNVGITNNETLIDFVEEQRDSGITLTTLGFGTGNYNEAMMEQIADHGNGNYGYIDSAMEARKVLGQELSSTLFTIASDVKIQVEFNPAVVAEYRLIGYENRALAEEDFDNDKVDAGDIGAGHQVTALYEIVPVGKDGWLPERRYTDGRTPIAGNAEEAAWLKLRYKLPGEDSSKLIEQPIMASALTTSRAPSGDFAFQAAVAAFAQRLRGDEMLGDFGYEAIERLAGRHDDYWRSEFVQLVGLAKSQSVMPDGGR